MKKIGLIGGMSWESSTIYYELMNRKVRELMGGFHSASCILDSLDFAAIQKLQHEDSWDKLDQIMADSAKRLEVAGAEIIMLCTNTMHLCSDAITRNITIPFLHIAEATGKSIQGKDLKKVALLGTRFTMERDFYKKKLLDDFNIEVVIPEEPDRSLIHGVIYNELVQGNFSVNSKQEFIKIINKLHKAGAEGVILGCTEIPLLVKQSEVDIPIFDTTKLHAEIAIELALSDQ